MCPVTTELRSAASMLKWAIPRHLLRGGEGRGVALTSPVRPTDTYNVAKTSLIGHFMTLLRLQLFRQQAGQVILLSSFFGNLSPFTEL